MHFIEQKINETLEKNYMPYAMSVIISRAIPEIDGFKPSHRKLLYTMYKMGLLSGNRTKSSNVVGQTMRLNPHGDMAIYETMVRLTKGNNALLHPFVDSKGNFGKQFSRDMAFAAARYTEVKLAEICREIFLDIDKDTVDFIDNYDSTTKEPTLLPVKFPSILVSPNQGIAVGMASNICSFNLSEVIKTTIAFLKREDCDLLKTLPAPDFTGGGEILYDKEQMEEIYKTGRGSIKIRGKYIHDKKNSLIEITEIPYTTTIEAIIEKIVDGIKSGKFKDITDVRDETDLSGLKITLDIKKSTDVARLMSILYKTTPLQDVFSCNFNILINGMPQVLGIKSILSHWSLFRINCIKRRLAFDIDKKWDRLHLLRGMEKILLDIDKAIKIVRNTQKDKDVIPALMEGFSIDEIQAESVAEIKLRNLNREYILNSISEIENLEKDIQNLSEILKDEESIKSIIIEELKEMEKKHAIARKTTLVDFDEDKHEIKSDDMIDDYSLKLFLTKEGYLKKISLVSLRSGGEQKLKEEDAITEVFESSNKEDLLLFSDKCVVYKVKNHEIPDCKASSMGEYTPNLLGLAQDEKIVSIAATADYSGHMLFGFEDGRVSKIPLSSYATKTNRKKLTGAYSSHAPLCSAIYIKEDIELAAFSSIDKAMVFSSAKIPEKTTRSSQGVKVVNLKKKSFMTKFVRLSQSGLKDPSLYKPRNIPATGSYLTQEDKMGEQMSLIE